MKSILVISIFLLLGIDSTGQKDEVLTIRFKTNSHSITIDNEKKLNTIIELCNSKEFHFIKIFGFSDPSGSEEYNYWLSKKRCYAVWYYIKMKTKIDEKKLYIEWLGESNETYDLHFDEAHAQERCVDIWIHLAKKN